MTEEQHEGSSSGGQVPESGAKPPEPPSGHGLPRVEPANPDTTPYELAPEPPAPAPTRAPAQPKPSKVGDKSFIDDLPEDADLETDPEVERALKGEPLKDEDEEEGEKTVDAGKPTFVKGAGDPKTLVLVGAVITLGTVIVSAWRNSDHWFSAGALALYLTILHTVSGVAATAIVAYFEKLRFGRIELAASRMLVAVSLGYLVISLGAGKLNAITAPVGILVYVIAVGVLFLLPVPRLVRVAAVHAVLIAALYLAMILYAAATEPSLIK